MTHSTQSRQTTTNNLRCIDIIVIVGPTLSAIKSKLTRDEKTQEPEKHKPMATAGEAAVPIPEAAGAIRRDEASGRYRFEFRGRAIYEFEQNLDEVTIYVVPPPYVRRGHQIRCVISANHFKLGLVGHSTGENKQDCQWYLNEDTFGTVDVDESTWTLEDNDEGDGGKVIVVTLIKANRGTVWEAALKGNPNTSTVSTNTTMDALSKEQVKKDLMLQRFQEENPGFDFRGADFNGGIPDAREFMGGVKYR